MFANKKNNVFFKIGNGLSTLGTLLVISGGKEDLIEDFLITETDKHFPLTIVKFNINVVIKREIVLVVAKSGKNLTIQRAYEECPINDSSVVMTQSAQEFDVGDYAYLNNTAGDFKKIESELNKKLDKGGLRTGLLNAWKIFFSNGDKNEVELSLGEAGQVLQSNGPNAPPTFNSPTVNIGGLSETTTPQSAWYTVVYNGTVNLKTTLSNFTKSLSYATKTLQGVLRFATDAEATTGTLDTVAITSKQAKDNYYSEIGFSDQVIGNSTSTPAATGPLTKKGEFTITRSGGYRIKATLICNTSSSSSYTNTVKIYKNGVEVATNSANLNTNGQTVATQIDLNLVAGDVIAGYIANSDSRTIQLSLDMCASAFPTIAKPTKNL